MFLFHWTNEINSLNNNWFAAQFWIRFWYSCCTGTRLCQFNSKSPLPNEKSNWSLDTLTDLFHIEPKIHFSLQSLHCWVWPACVKIMAISDYKCWPWWFFLIEFWKIFAGLRDFLVKKSTFFRFMLHEILRFYDDFDGKFVVKGWHVADSR